MWVGRSKLATHTVEEESVDDDERWTHPSPRTMDAEDRSALTLQDTEDETFAEVARQLIDTGKYEGPFTGKSSAASTLKSIASNSPLSDLNVSSLELE